MALPWWLEDDEELKTALSTLTKKRRAVVEDRLMQAGGLAKAKAQEMSDMRIVIKDQQAHIRNLEEQLRPRLVAAVEVVQEELL